MENDTSFQLDNGKNKGPWLYILWVGYIEEEMIFKINHKIRTPITQPVYL